MDDQFRRNLETLTRVRDYGATTKSAFPPGSRTIQLFDELPTVITQLQTASAAQASGTMSAREVTTSKTLAREALIEELRSISLTARSLSVTMPGLEDKFRLPRGVGDQVLLAGARAFAKDAAPLKAEFIALEMPADFLEQLEAAIAALEAALTGRHTTQHSKTTATTSMDGLLERGLSIVKQLQAPVQNRFRGDEAMLASWRRASRTERSHRPGRVPEIPSDDSGDGKTPGEPPKTLPGTGVA